MKLLFVTTNKHKFAEVADVLSSYPVTLEWLNREYAENHDDSLEDIAKDAARSLAHELQQPVVVEDSGLFFEAYGGFPGALPKFVMNTLGFKGIFKLLEGETRNAYFKAVVAFCEPGEEPVLFTGVMKGEIADTIYNDDKDVMPYDKIFIPAGKRVTISDLSMDEKNSLSHRAEAFRAFGEYVRKR